jgi:SCY1-like protein 2
MVRYFSVRGLNLTNSYLDVLPIINACIDSPTHSIVDAALRKLSFILPVLDFSTIKNDLFPVIATVFSKTSSLSIKVRGLEAFVILCGGFDDSEPQSDGLDGIIGTSNKKRNAPSALDKYTMQEKVLPLVKAIKTKEPAVMVAALKVLKQIGSVADIDFIAMEILPILWGMSLGPLLDLKEFQSFMELIKSLSSRVEEEHTKKLQELSGSTRVLSNNGDSTSFGKVVGFTSSNDVAAGNSDDDFERLVQGNPTSNGSSSNNPLGADWDAAPTKPLSTAKPTAAFSWSSTVPKAPDSSKISLRPQQAPSRTITPDLARFDTLVPSTAQFSQPPQPTTNSQYSLPLQPTANYNISVPLQPQVRSTPQATSMNWSMSPGNAWASTTMPSTATPSSLTSPMSNISMSQQQQPGVNRLSSFSLPPPPSSNNFQIPPPSVSSNTLSGAYQQPNSLQSFYGISPQSQQDKPRAQKSGLDAYESLL